MNILKFLLINWDNVLVVVAVSTDVIVLIVKKQYGILSTMIFSLVTEAEKKYGSGTGTIKLAAVIEWLYPKIPMVIRLFLTQPLLEKLIGRVLIEAKERWAKNSKLSGYIKS